jgi:hypothetical protein
VTKKGLNPWLAFGLIILVTVLTYGILIPQLGFYRDDWYLFSTAQAHGPTGIVGLFQIDRPLVGYFYAVGYELLGLAPLAWQVAALVMRLAGNAAFLWLLRLLWPERDTETLSVALLFSVYPGFTVEPNAGVYITDLAAEGAAIFSFVLTIKALQARTSAGRVLLSVAAGLLVLFYLGIFESAIGLEAARFGLVWYLTWRQSGQGFRTTFLKALRTDLLYLLLAGAFLIWRLLIFQSTRRATNLSVLVGKYSALPVRSVLSILVETVKDVVETTVFAWIVPFYQAVAISNYRDLAIAVVLGLLVAAAIFVLLRQASREPLESRDTTRSFQNLHLVLLGAWIVIFALLPIDLAGRNVLFEDQWDRYTIYASAGVAMVVGGFVFGYVHTRVQRPLLMILIGMAVVVHYFSAAAYRDSWASQRDLWQQMAWRAPALQRGTMLFVVLPSAGYEEGYEIYGPANMIYYPGQGVLLGADVLNSTTATNLELQKNREHFDRDVLVPDNYRNALIAIYPSPQSCLHVLDGRKVELPGLLDNSLVVNMAPYSRIDVIEVNASPVKLPAFLGGEKPHAWCQYYQSMDLARQTGDWQRVAQLADEAQGKDLTPDDVSEWMPALEAYVTLGRMQDARHAASIIRSSDAARAFLCLQLQRGAAYAPPYDYNEVNQTLCQAG